jgi:Delta24-sterol reductase
MADPLVRARPKRKKVLADYLVRLRWIPALFVALPISALIYLSVFLVNTWSAMKSEKRRQKEHQENVERVVKRLKERDPKRDVSASLGWVSTRESVSTSSTEEAAVRTSRRKM